MHTIIFTDLDGTFLNHHTYSFNASKEARSLVALKKIPLIFTTSKTQIEVEQLQQKVAVKEPFIVENGAALFVPKNYQGFDFSFLKPQANYYVLQLGVSYVEVLKFYQIYKKEFGMVGFSDMTIEQVTENTGLSTENAKLSKNRGFTEPFLLEKQNQLPRLEKLAAKHQLKITKGGRFYHLIGQKQDKGKAVKQCIALFEKIYQKKVTSIGLGDGENDIPLLENVEIPIAIKNSEGTHISLKNKKVLQSTYPGDKGWNQMILQCLEKK